jgi:single-strand DNA-binding protein
MAQLSGLFRIGRDAEVRVTSSGDSVVSLSLAFNYYDKNAEKNKGSQWIEAALFGKRAESIAPYLIKGGLIYATINDPHIETYEGKNGTGHKLVGKIGEIELAGGKPDGQRTEQKPANSASKPEHQPQNKSFDEDDIPF